MCCCLLNVYIRKTVICKKLINIWAVETVTKQDFSSIRISSNGILSHFTLSSTSDLTEWELCIWHVTLMGFSFPDVDLLVHTDDLHSSVINLSITNLFYYSSLFPWKANLWLLPFVLVFIIKYNTHKLCHKIPQLINIKKYVLLI